MILKREVGSISKGRIKELERKMRKRKMKEGVEEVLVIGEEEGKVEVYNAKIGVCRIKSEREYEKGTRLRIAIYKVEEKTKIALLPDPAIPDP
jgi:hypothetical protein